MLFTPSDPVRNLHRLEIFAGCTKRELRAIDGLTTAATLPAGRVLCRQGEIARECFVVVNGEVDVSFGARHATLGSGALVGEIVLFSPEGLRTATVTTKTAVTLLVLTRTELARLMAAVPVVAHRIVRESARRLAEDASL